MSCKYCLEGGDNLVQPCACAAGVHVECLEVWRSRRSPNEASKCEICSQKYNVVLAPPPSFAQDAWRTMCSEVDNVGPFFLIGFCLFLLMCYATTVMWYVLEEGLSIGVVRPGATAQAGFVSSLMIFDAMLSFYCTSVVSGMPTLHHLFSGPNPFVAHIFTVYALFFTMPVLFVVMSARFTWVCFFSRA